VKGVSIFLELWAEILMALQVQNASANSKKFNLLPVRELFVSHFRKSKSNTSEKLKVI
jgi:hypothetical protein